MRLSRFLLLPILPCAVLALAGFGARESSSAGESEPGFYRDRTTETARRPEPAESGEPELVTVSGRVRLVGSDFWKRLVIGGEDGEWYVEAGGDRDRLAALQQRKVTVEGWLSAEDVVMANGEYMGKRLILRDLRIIAVEE
jgi:hypothetical protein